MAEGFFRSKQGFTVVQNDIVNDTTVSLKAKGLYLIIQSNITRTDRKWTKTDFLNMSKEGIKAFDSAWSELKELGYLKVHMMPGNGHWNTEYELLDQPEPGTHTYYYNKAGERTGDNNTRAEKKTRKETEKEVETPLPQKGGNGKTEPQNDHYPHYGSNGNGSNAKGTNAYGSNANGGNNITKTIIKPKLKTDNNTYHNNQERESYPKELVEKLVDVDWLYEHMKENEMEPDDVDTIIKIIYDTLNCSKSTLRVCKENKPKQVVISKLLKLKREDIVYAWKQFMHPSKPIESPVPYMLTLLYQANEQNVMSNATKKANGQVVDKKAEDEKKPRNSFHDFNQRHYSHEDIQKIERSMLGLGKEKK